MGLVPEILELVMSSILYEEMTEGELVSEDGQTISFHLSSASPPTLEVSTSSRKMASWSQSVLQDRSMKTIWIGIGYPKKGKALLSSSKTYYQKTSKGWKLSSMNLHRGIPIGVKKNCSPLDMVKGRGFNPN
tara:strand:- start:213 stop:608 length:396 start_codon:yes stop_codon:yes gene_type:complete